MWLQGRPANSYERVSLLPRLGLTSPEFLLGACPGRNKIEFQEPDKIESPGPDKIESLGPDEMSVFVFLYVLSLSLPLSVSPPKTSDTNNTKAPYESLETVHPMP